MCFTTALHVLHSNLTGILHALHYWYIITSPALHLYFTQHHCNFTCTLLLSLAPHSNITCYSHVLHCCLSDHNHVLHYCFTFTSQTLHSNVTSFASVNFTTTSHVLRYYFTCTSQEHHIHITTASLAFHSNCTATSHAYYLYFTFTSLIFITTSHVLYYCHLQLHMHFMCTLTSHVLHGCFTSEVVVKLSEATVKYKWSACDVAVKLLRGASDSSTVHVKL